MNYADELDKILSEVKIYSEKLGELKRDTNTLEDLEVAKSLINNVASSWEQAIEKLKALNVTGVDEMKNGIIVKSLSEKLLVMNDMAALVNRDVTLLASDEFTSLLKKFNG